VCPPFTSCEALSAWSTFWQAIGTVAAVVVALGAVVFDVISRWREGRRRQAELVAGWFDSSSIQGDTSPIVLVNSSRVPVYEVVVSLVLIQGAGPREGRQLSGEMSSYRVVVDTLPPGTWMTEMEGGWGGMSRWPGVEVAFTDVAGRHWVRTADGAMRRLRVAPHTWYNIDPPFSYRRLRVAAGTGPLA